MHAPWCLELPLYQQQGTKEIVVQLRNSYVSDAHKVYRLIFTCHHSVCPKKQQVLRFVTQPCPNLQLVEQEMGTWHRSGKERGSNTAWGRNMSYTNQALKKKECALK